MCGSQSFEVPWGKGVAPQGGGNLRLLLTVFETREAWCVCPGEEGCAPHMSRGRGMMNTSGQGRIFRFRIVR